MRSGPSMKARVKVSASTSNLGAGFDCVGVAVDRWLTATVAITDSRSGVTMKRAGASAGLSIPPGEDLVHTGFRLVCEISKQPLPRSLDYEVNSTIPVARGLGASAAALVAGAFLANDSLNLGLSREQIATACARYEGHPDNAGPAVFGGAVLGVPASDGTSYRFASLRIHQSLALVFAVPPLEVLTAEARAVLPESLPYQTAVRAVAKASALIEGLSSGDGDLLTFALDDVIHVPFRRQLVPGYDAVVTAAVEAGAFGATLSGSGSTMVAITESRNASNVGGAMQSAWREYKQTAEIIISEKLVDGASIG